MNEKKKQIIIVIIYIAIVIFSLSIFKVLNNPQKHYNKIISEYDKELEHRQIQFEDEYILRCYDLGAKVGFIVLSEGYEEGILIYAELGSENVERVKVLYHNETEEYGDYVVEDWFLKRFYLPFDSKFVTVKNRRENANEIIAITGATITSDAVVFGINKCIDKMEDIKVEQENKMDIYSCNDDAHVICRVQQK